MRSELAAGSLPAASIADGVIILLAAAVLITPGILTDAFGFLCLVPAFRRALKSMLWRQLKRAVHEGRVSVTMQFEHHGAPPPYRADEEAPAEPGSPPSLPKPRA